MCRILRTFALATVLLAVCGAAVAQIPDCEPANGAPVEDAVLTILPDIDADTTQLTLTGRAAYPGVHRPDQAQGPAYAFCMASVGGDLTLNGEAVCDEFRALAKEDRVRASDGIVHFQISATKYEADEGRVELGLPEGRTICSADLVIELKHGRGFEYGQIDTLPEYLGADELRYRLRHDPEGLRTQIWVTLQRDFSGDDRSFLKAPPSWSEGDYLASSFWRLVAGLFMAISVLGLLGIAMHRQPLPSSQMSEPLSRPLTVVLALSLAAGFLSTGGATAPLVYEHLFNLRNELGATWLPDLRISSHSASLSLPFLAIALIGSAVVAGALRLIGGRRWRPGSPASIFTTALLTGACLSLAVGGFAAGLEALERELVLVFEAPALMVSLVCAVLGVWAVKTQTKWSGLAVAGLGVLIAVTAFYPSSAVVRGDGGAMVATNTFFWAITVFSAAAGYLYVAALALFAFSLVADDRMSPALLARWLVILLILQVAGFGINVPANALAVGGVLLLSTRWLFAQSRLDAVPPPPVPAGGSFPFLVGGASAAIFLAQYIFSTPEQSFAALPLMELAGVPRAFAIGAVGGLVLWRGFPYLRGDSATLKAANVSLMIVVTDMASNMESLRGQDALVSVLTGNMGVMAALIFGALIYFDLDALKTRGAGATWRDIFKGTTLAHAVPVVSAIAAALFSALGPILIDEVKSAFSEMVRTANPVAGQSPGAAAEDEAAPRGNGDPP